MQNDYEEFIEFLKQNIDNKEWHISYNGLAFDAQITHYIIENREMFRNLSGCAIAEILYKYAQECIDRIILNVKNIILDDLSPLKMINNNMI